MSEETEKAGEPNGCVRVEATVRRCEECAGSVKLMEGITIKEVRDKERERLVRALFESGRFMVMHVGTACGYLRAEKDDFEKVLNGT